MSLRHFLPEDVIIAIYESQFKRANEAIRVGEKGKPDTFLNIQFMHLGRLIAKPERVLKLTKEVNKHEHTNISKQDLDRETEIESESEQ